jgi:hypothetical protein
MNQHLRLPILLLLLVLILPKESNGQSRKSEGSIGFTKPEISITPFYGFVFNERFQTEFGNVLLNQSQCYGVSLGFRPSSWKQLELSWRHQISLTEGDIFYYNGFNRLVEEQVEGDMAIDYFMLGANGIKDVNDRFAAYGGLSAGVVVFTPQVTDYTALVRFAVALRGGVHVKFNDHVGIRLQPELHIPLQAVGANVFVSNATSGVGVSAYSTIAQFGGSSGITITF